MISTLKRGASAQTLARFPQFSHLDSATLQRLADASSVETLPAGRLLFKPGVREHQHLYLLSGEVALVSDSRPVGDVSAGTADAEQELAPERPRKFWGWSKSRVELLCVAAELTDAPEADSARSDTTPEATPEPAAAPSAAPGTGQVQLDSLRQALRDTERDRDQARLQVEQLQARVGELEQQLAQTRARLQQAETAVSAQPAAPRVQPEPVVTPSANDSPALPSLRLDPSERDRLAPAEIDEVLGAWSAHPLVGEARERRS